MLELEGEGERGSGCFSPWQFRHIEVSNHFGLLIWLIKALLLSCLGTCTQDTSWRVDYLLWSKALGWAQVSPTIRVRSVFWFPNFTHNTLFHEYAKIQEGHLLKLSAHNRIGGLRMTERSWVSKLTGSRPSTVDWAFEI